MKFEYTRKNQPVTDPELISDLMDVARILKKDSLSMEEYQKNGKYDTSTISRRFGTWNVALEKAGLAPRNRFHTEQELLDNLYNVWISKGKQPTRNDMNNHDISCVSSGAYIRKYGKWSTALKAFVEYTNSLNLTNSINDTMEPDSKRTPREINLRLRFMVMKRDNFKCCICGTSPANDSTVILHVDHIKPYSKGGETTMDNLRTLCSKCNLGKSDLYDE